MTKIMLIDDSALSRNVFKRALGDKYAFIEAPDGMSGLEKYYLEKPDLVILDLTLPGMNGLDVLEQLKKIDPQVKVIIGTADIQETSRRMAMELGAASFITKPFTSENIVRTVEATLNQMDQAASRH